MNKKLIATAIAAALAAPSAFAAEGADGMNYTSASEGFYGTLRVRYDTGSTEDDTATITTGGTSQIGVAGTLDLGNGLTGFYQWETNVDGGQAAATALRKKTLGIRGGFGEVKFGSFTDTTISVSGRTDVANSISGNFDLSPSYRVDNAVAYTTPDLNGFQAHFRLIANTNMQENNRVATAADVAANVTRPTFDTPPNTDAPGAPYEVVPLNGIIPGMKADENTVDDWAVGASYSVQGFDVSGVYRTHVDGTKTNAVDVTAADNDDADGVFGALDSHASYDDRNLWGIGAGYGQDNWNLATWYGEAEPTTEGGVDTEYFSIAGDVTVGKTKVYAFTETAENVGGEDGMDNTVSGVGVQYSFTTQSRVWLDYQANDNDGSATEDDKVVIGLRYDF